MKKAWWHWVGCKNVSTVDVAPKVHSPPRRRYLDTTLVTRRMKKHGQWRWVTPYKVGACAVAGYILLLLCKDNLLCAKVGGWTVHTCYSYCHSNNYWWAEEAFILLKLYQSIFESIVRKLSFIPSLFTSYLFFKEAKVVQCSLSI